MCRRPTKPICQVEGCSADLEACRPYCIKRRMCEEHLRADCIRMGHKGLFRFCQQCGKLESLSKFEGMRRSCRKSLMHRLTPTSRHSKQQTQQRRHSDLELGAAPAPTALPVIKQEEQFDCFALCIDDLQQEQDLMQQEQDLMLLLQQQQEAAAMLVSPCVSSEAAVAILADAWCRYCQEDHSEEEKHQMEELEDALCCAAAAAAGTGSSLLSSLSGICLDLSGSGHELLVGACPSSPIADAMYECGPATSSCNVPAGSVVPALAPALAPAAPPAVARSISCSSSSSGCCGCNCGLCSACIQGSISSLVDEMGSTPTTDLEGMFEQELLAAAATAAATAAEPAQQLLPQQYMACQVDASGPAPMLTMPAARQVDSDWEDRLHNIQKSLELVSHELQGLKSHMPLVALCC